MNFVLACTVYRDSDEGQVFSAHRVSFCSHLSYVRLLTQHFLLSFHSLLLFL